MSELSDILTGTATIKRLTPYLLDGVTPEASMTADRQPAKTSRLSVKIEGAAVSGGLVNVAGNVNETFNFSADGTMIGEEDFTSISGITISGIDGGSIWIKGLNSLGEPIVQEKTVHSDLPIRFYAQAGHIRMKQPGQQKIAKYKIMADTDADLEENDIFYAGIGVAGLTIGQLDFVETLYDFDGNIHHREAEIVEI